MRRPRALRRASTAVDRAAEGFSRTTGVVSSLSAIVGSDWCGHLRGLGTCPAVATGARNRKATAVGQDRAIGLRERPMTSSARHSLSEPREPACEGRGRFLGLALEGQPGAGEGWSGLRQRRGQARWRLRCGRHERRSRVDPLQAERGRGGPATTSVGRLGPDSQASLPPKRVAPAAAGVLKAVSGPLHRPQTDVPPVDGGVWERGLRIGIGRRAGREATAGPHRARAPERACRDQAPAAEPSSCRPAQDPRRPVRQAVGRPRGRAFEMIHGTSASRSGPAGRMASLRPKRQP